MRAMAILLGIAIVVLMAGGVQGATSTPSTVSLATLGDAVNSVYVSSVRMDPEVFYPGETGSITVVLNNSGTMTVTMGSPVIYDPNIEVYNSNSYASKSRIGGGDTLEYTFEVSVNTSDGKNTFFPIFSVNPSIGNAVHTVITLKTDSEDLQATVTGQPDVFTLNNEGTVNLTLINPRNAAIKNIRIRAGGPGLSVNPSETYVSSVKSLNSTTLNFKVTPSQNTNLTFNISFTSYGTVHSQTVTIPIILGVDKKSAVPVVNNPSLTDMGSYYDIKADISNAGVSDAKGMIVTVLAPAKVAGTYPEYAVGTLSSDDSTSFEVTFTYDDLSRVPLEIIWKDAAGNNYNATKILDLSGSSGYISSSSASSSISSSSSSSSTSSTGYGYSSSSSTRSRSLFNRGGNVGTGFAAFYPIIIGGIVIVAAGILWFKRKWVLAHVKRK